MGEEKIVWLQGRLEPFDVDVEKGIGFCCDYDTYVEILELAAKSSKEKMSEITRYKAEGNIADYIVQVHALKSSLANIGAGALSAKAKALEFAGKDNDIAFINDNTEAFVKEYSELMDGIMGVLESIRDNSGEEDSVRKSITHEIWQENIEKLIYYIDELEDEYASDIIEKLLAYDIDEEALDGLSQIKDYLESYDMEQARELAEKLKNCI